MRCNFCGWENPQNKQTCEKCNKPLSAGDSVEGHRVGSGTVPENHDRPTDRKNAITSGLKETIREEQSRVEEGKCPECGYEMDGDSCPQCGYSKRDSSAPVEAKRQKVELRMTERPRRKAGKEPSFRLTPISEETGETEGETLLFEGETTVLNRDNTDPKNSTITSREQAAVTFENGKWSIEDKSEYRTTFVQAAGKITLQSGSLILIGNQLYRFEE